MLRPLSIKHPPEDVFVWSDMHISHDKPWIWQARGFKDITGHDDALIARWNEVCTDTSIVFHLGDMTFGDPEGKRFEELVRRLRFGALYHQWGNHTSGARQVYQRVLASDYLDRTIYAGQELYPLTWDLFDKQVVFLPQYVEVKVGKQEWVMCHYALEVWNGMAKGWVHACGHSHGNLKTQRARRRDVGVDAYPRGPVSFAALLHEMRNEKADIVDHHGTTYVPKDTP